IFALIEHKDWDSGKVSIDDKGEVIDVLLEQNKTNHFDVKLFDGSGNALECEPSEIQITQGVDPGAGKEKILSHSIGIGTARKSDGREVFTWADEFFDKGIVAEWNWRILYSFASTSNI
ncbi:hypothetical protein N9J52_03500, partial [Flavobacteriales bacterium]|nr:hypothetical protein [Flavobacteriales bacterium]